MLIFELLNKFFLACVAAPVLSHYLFVLERKPYRVKVDQQCR